MDARLHRLLALMAATVVAVAAGASGAQAPGGSGERRLTPIERAAKQIRTDAERGRAAAEAVARAAAAVEKAERAAEAASAAAADAEKARNAAREAYAEAQQAAETARGAARQPPRAAASPGRVALPAAPRPVPAAPRTTAAKKPAQRAAAKRPPQSRPPQPLPTSVAGKTLADCVAALNAQGSGWCEMGEPISSVWPKGRDDVRGVTGPKSILIAWNGMAFDRRGKKLYFLANGGHADYLGNEVYEFDLKTGQWTRLTEPCPLTLEITPATEPYGSLRVNKGQSSAMIPQVECGPSAAHTYDGVQFASKTGTVFWVGGIYGAPQGTFGSHKELWEFNPSRTETRNGVPPLTWKLHRKADGTPLHVEGWPTSVELPDGDILMAANSHNGWRFDPADPAGTMQKAGGMNNNYGDGNLIYDEGRDALWFVTLRHGLWRLTVEGGKEKVAGKFAGFGMGAAVRDGKLILWGGKNTVAEFDPETGKSVLFDWKGKKPGKGDYRVYSKWVYLAEEDVFVGVTDASAGVLVYRHPKTGGVTPSPVKAQSFIDAAAAGSSVTIPPGVYAHGIFIDKPLTVKLDGVEFLSPIKAKGYVVVNAQGPVVIDGLTVDRPPGCGTNCAGVRIGGADYDVTIRNATILNQEMGVLTGNEGGRLVIEDSVIGDTKGADPSSLSHVVYIGYTDALIIRNSTIARSHDLGHLVKSRAARTVLENVKVLGGHSNHSRVVDYSCGGELIITGSVLEQSDMTDNAEIMLVGGAKPRNCMGNDIRPTTLTITDTVIRSLRDRSVDEPARTYGKTTLTKWRVAEDPATNIVLRNVTFEGVEQLTFAEWGHPSLPLPGD